MYNDKRKISLLMAPSGTIPARTSIAVLTTGAAAARGNYHALLVCGVRATKAGVAPNYGLPEEPSAEQGSAGGSAMQRAPGNVPVLALLPALVYVVLLPLGLAESQTQGQELSPRG